METGIRSGNKPRAFHMQKLYLICGILSSVLYIAMNIFVPIQFKGYSSVSQTVSELSAIDAPTRSLWISLGIVYTLLVAFFGWGVLQSALQKRPLQIVGGLLIAYGVIGLAWPLAPMHQREVLAVGGATITDTMHIVFSIVTVLLMLLAIGFGATAFGKWFRFYSLATIVILLVLGAWTGMDGAKLNANLPTPWLGVVERFLIGLFLVWIAVLAIAVLQMQKRQYRSMRMMRKEATGGVQRKALTI